jgi:predicted  nucleic acid-binding Zn-ribbon protein
LVRAVKPDRILCVQPEIAPLVSALDIPIAVDFYAPRLLEAAFEEGTQAETVNTLRSLEACDFPLFSNPRQRWFYLGLMAMSGFDVTAECGAIVPLVAHMGPKHSTPKEPIFVMGGVSWPWQDPSQAITVAVKTFEKLKKGRLHIYGGPPIIGDAEVVDLIEQLPPSARLEFKGVVPYTALQSAYSKATAALDIMAPNPERELAVSFRQMEYLGCGLPIITGNNHAMSDLIDGSNAGWTLELSELEALLTSIIEQPKTATQYGKNARKLAKSQFSRTDCEAPLVEWVQTATVRKRLESPLVESAELMAEVAAHRVRAEAAVSSRHKAELELETKRTEVSEANATIRTLTTTNSRLASAIDEVAGFKREAVATLGAKTAADSASLKVLRAENSRITAELAKKAAEGEGLRREFERLKLDITASTANATNLQEQLRLTAKDEADLRASHQASAAKLENAVAEAARLSTDKVNIQARMSEQTAELDKSQSEASGLSSQLHKVEIKAASLATERDAHKADLKKKSTEIKKLQAAGRSERKASQSEINSRDEKIEELTGTLHRLEAKLEASQAKVESLTGDLNKKSRELAESLAAFHRNSVELEGANGENEVLQADLVKKSQELADNLPQFHRNAASLETAQAQVGALNGDLEKKSHELTEANNELHRIHDKAGRYESELDRVNRELEALKKENDRLSRRRLF